MKLSPLEKIIIEYYNQGLSTEDISLKVKDLLGENKSGRSIERIEAKLRARKLIGYRRDLEINFDDRKAINDYKSKCVDVIKDLKNITNELPIYRVIKKSSVSKGDTLCIQLSDWHNGRLVRNEDNEEVFNEKIFDFRTKRFMTELLSLLDNYIIKGTPIKDVVIISTGDLVDGTGIFPTQALVSEYAPPFQVMNVVRVILSLVASLLKRNLNVYFYGVKGNHGEIRVMGKNKDPNANFDLMIYLFLEYLSKTMYKNKNFAVKYSELDYLNFTVQDWRYHIRHFAPQQSETAAGKAKFLGWAKKHDFDVLCYGHYHHYGIFDRSCVTIIRGGALCGSDDYAEQLAEDSPAEQNIWGVSKNRPVTFFYPLDLGKRDKREI